MDPLDILITHKRGDSFAYAGAVALPAGTWTGAAQLRRPTQLDADPPTATLEVVMTAPAGPITTWGVLLASPATATALWPATVLYCDVQFSDGSVPPEVISTQTFAVEITKDVTRG